MPFCARTATLAARRQAVAHRLGEVVVGQQQRQVGIALVRLGDAVEERARMMQPPRQILAMRPRSMFQSYSALAAADLIKALRISDHLGGVESLPHVLHKFRPGQSLPVAVLPVGSFARADFIAVEPILTTHRAMVASAMPVIAHQDQEHSVRSSGPVPFCSARCPAQMSTNGLPGLSGRCGSAPRR
jgi:hypothetical protein